MSRIKSLKIKITDTDFGEPIPFGADAENVDMSDGNSVEDAIKVRVTQDFDSTGYGNAEDINADRVKGHSIEELYSDFISITVPAASAVPNSEGLYYADVTVKGINPTKAILGIQMAYDTSISPEKALAAYQWDYLETGTNKVSFYSTTQWANSFTIVGVVVQAEEGEY